MATAHPIPSDPRFIDMTGREFERLTVISFAGRKGSGNYWNCDCKCGKKTVSDGTKLRSGLTKSCGCHSQEVLLKLRTTHGQSKSPVYFAWKAMRERCHCKTNKQYDYYGGRGITVCKRWHKFENFISDMGERPKGKLTIERRNNNKGYFPNNCYWATPIQQGRNKRNNVILTFDGRTQCMSAWAEEIGVSKGTLHARLKSGIPLETALTMSLWQRTA